MDKKKTIKIPCTGYSVVADWYKGKNKNEILLVLIGYSSNRKKQYDLVSNIVNGTGMNALVFDYSGHGDSPFELDETRPAQHFLEVIYVFDWLKSKYPNTKINILGSSYGGYLATQLTKYRKFNKLVLRVPAIYSPNAFYNLQKEVHSDWNKKIFRRNKKLLASHPLLIRASKFKGKTLVVVHGKDEQIPKETTDAYIKAFNADVYLAESFTHSMGHIDNSRDKFGEYQNKIVSWLRKT